MQAQRRRRWRSSAALLAAGGGQGARSPGELEGGAAAWRGFVDGERSAVAVGERMIVVLRNPSLADRMAEAGGRATESAMRSWTAAALAGQKQIAARLSREGIQLVPDFVYTRTFNGFAAPIDGRALALLERDPTSSASTRCAPPIPPHSRAPSFARRSSPPAAAGGPTSGCRGSTAAG